ncbi:MAG TPA: alanine racemase, partial [Gammaproteobacteria bacterium]|nr:alanine racemase [Gammaproteobacteria bacterium]
MSAVTRTGFRKTKPGDRAQSPRARASGPSASGQASPSGMLRIDLDALARNYAKLERRAAPSECGAVVKADAYGLGLAQVAHRLAREGCRRFFVATAQEGLEL